MTQHVDRIEPNELEREIEACKAVLEGGAGDTAAPDAVLGDLRKRVEGDLATEKGALARLRALPTSQRILVVLATMTAMTVLSVVLTPRPDLAEYPAVRMAVSLALLAVVTGAATWRLLRPLYAPPPSIWLSRALLVMGPLLPLALALIPIDHSGAHPGEGAAFAVQCSKCLAFGGFMGFPVLLLALLARRSRMDGAAVAALGGVAAALTGDLALQLHCPITNPAHLIVGHALLVVVVAVVAALWHR
jgi:hypothetical protein